MKAGKGAPTAKQIQTFIKRLQEVPHTKFMEFDANRGIWSFTVEAGEWY